VSLPADQRVAAIEQALSVLQPSELSVLDESHLHRGHAGARDGRGHFAVRIRAAALANASPLARHRLVYQQLGDLMTTDIHALRIDAG
jgi:BolA family transcriptional regulator, general stress-responsive regulator